MLKDRVKVNIATEGTGILTLGAAFSGFQGFDALGTGIIKTYYSLVNGADWETGEGIYNSSNSTMDRSIIFESSNSGNTINLSGTSSLFISYPAKTSVYLDSNSSPSSGQYLVANIDKSFTAKNLTYTDIQSPLTTVYTLNSNQSTIVDSSSGNAVKYLIKAEYGNDIQLQESLIISKSNNVYITVYGQLYTSAQPLFSLDATSLSGIINLYIGANSSGTIMHIYKINI